MKYSKHEIDQAIQKKYEGLISQYGLRISKRIVTRIKKKLLAEDRRRKQLNTKGK